MSNNELPEAVSPDALAALVGLTGRRVRQILSAAGVKPVSRGQVPLDAALRALLESARSTRAETPEARERARLVAARAREVELRTAERRRELVPVEDATAALDLVVGTVVSELVALPVRCSREITVRRKIEAEVDGLRTRVVARLRGEIDRLHRGELLL